MLTLKGLPLAVYFTDRPVRKAGHLTLEEFIAMWNQRADEYQLDPPNAELAIYKEDGDKHSVLILGKPELNGDTISFKVKVFHGIIPGKFDHSTLFIDPLGVIYPSNQN